MKSIICDILRELVQFVQFKALKNTEGGVILLVTKTITKLGKASHMLFLHSDQNTY